MSEALLQPDAVISVLIVDDQPLTRMILKTALVTTSSIITPKLQWVGEAENGQDAIVMAQALRPDVVLMDIGMPIMDGIEATREIHARCPEIRIIMLTTHDGEDNIMSAFRSGAQSYCLKDTPSEQLAHVIVATCQGASWIDPKIAQVVIRHSLQQPLNAAPADVSANRPQPSPDDLIAPLTARELEVLQMISEGKNNPEICDALSLSPNTIKTHIKSIFMKMDVQDRTAAALKAIHGGWVKTKPF